MIRSIFECLYQRQRGNRIDHTDPASSIRGIRMYPKRLLDIAASLFLVLLAGPLVPAAALAIFLESGRPILFHQKRVGKDGVVFTLLKLRSMSENAEKNGAVWTERNDSRITRVGKWLRLFRIDEIPQLWNVLKGEMSIVGPRPERPEFVKEFVKRTPSYALRHKVKPGLTGWAQVNYPYGASNRDAFIKLEYDLFYIKNMSLLLDLRILIKTIGVVVFHQGAR